MLDATFADPVAPVVLRAEIASDVLFLDDLAMACSPLATLVSEDMIRQQAMFQRTGHEAAYPAAMRRIAIRQDRRIGRLAIDWAPDHSRCVDIAIVPAMRGAGIGTALLAAWLTAADRLGLPTRLSVRYDNPAVVLYRRLGFTERGDDCAPTPMLEMVRAR